MFMFQCLDEMVWNNVIIYQPSCVDQLLRISHENALCASIFFIFAFCIKILWKHMKTLNKEILNSIWSVQDPNAGWNTPQIILLVIQKVFKMSPQNKCFARNDQAYRKCHLATSFSVKTFLFNLGLARSWITESKKSRGVMKHSSPNSTLANDANREYSSSSFRVFEISSSLVSSRLSAV